MPRYRRASSHAPTRDRAGMMSLASAFARLLAFPSSEIPWPLFSRDDRSELLSSYVHHTSMLRGHRLPRLPSSLPTVHRVSYRWDRAAQSETANLPRMQHRGWEENGKHSNRCHLGKLHDRTLRGAIWRELQPQPMQPVLGVKATLLGLITYTAVHQLHVQ